ncbi:MAG: hypothetical protein IJS65_03315 [Clostridia bacterium]|nr:hypothetical protein [Clostridia bacterium]
MENNAINFDLTLFGGAEACPRPAGGCEITSGETESDPGPARREDTGDTIQTPEAQASGSGTDAGDRERGAFAQDDLKREYDDFVRTHKEIDEKRIQDLINRRFKETKGLEEEVKRLSERVRRFDPVVARLAEKYGVKAEETSSVLDAFLKDTYFSAEKEAAQETAGEDGKRNAEAAETPEKPTLDPVRDKDEKELPRLLEAGVTPERAYMLLHIDELLAETARRAAENAERETVARLREKGARPAENGVSQGSGFIIKNDVSRLTKKDREDAIRRSLRGELVTFRD